jgi:hypothetical protein
MAIHLAADCSFCQRRSMKRRVFLALIASLAPGFSAEPPTLYPFEVTLGGQKAVMKNPDGLFAVVPEPVEGNAKLGIAEKSPMLIVNAFPCNEDGTVLMDRPAAVIFVSDANEVKLDETIDKQKLGPGTYLMNVVAHSKTSRVVFTVTDGKTRLKLPDLSKIVEFLKGK